MQRNVVLLVCLIVILTSTVTGYDSPQKSKTIRKLNDLVSTYMTPAQMITLMDKSSAKIGNGVDPKKIASEFKNDLIATLTAKQMGDITMKGLAAGSKLGNQTVFDLLDTLGTVLYNNLLAFVTQLCDLAESYRQRGIDNATTDAIGFGKVNQFLTYKRMDTIFCRFRSYYTKTQWQGIFTNFKGMFLMAKYPCCVPS